MESQMDRSTAIYNSMTKKERLKPESLDGNRRHRIASAGVQPNEVGQFIKQFEMSRDMMQSFGGMGMKGKMGLMKNLMSGNLAGLGMPGGPQLRVK